MPWLQPTDLPRVGASPTAERKSHDLPLTLGSAVRPASASSTSTGAGMARLLHWLPVALALVLLAQIALFGFSPALAESRRLDDAEARLVDNFDSELESQVQLERTARARQDPIYLERERRSRLSASGVSSPGQ